MTWRAIRWCRAGVPLVLVFAPVAHAATSGPSVTRTVTVQAESLTPQFSGYGQVQPLAPLPISAIEAGVIARLKVIPGSQVQVGEVLATLTGPEIQSLLTSRQGAVRSAQSQLTASQRTLAIERQQLSAQMSTQQAVAAAQSAVAAAQSAADTAQSQLRLAEDMQTLRAPTAGTVLSLNAAEGERVAAGQTVLMIQTANRLWLAATYYGADAQGIRIGMTGQFLPASGAAPVAVKVMAISAALAPDAGESVGLVATNAGTASAGAGVSAPWSNGEWGMVTLTGATQSLVSVPTRALILDQAQWWVMVQSASGLRSQPVVPGPTRGWDTFIERGLSPGQQVVVDNAYLEYHRGIAQRYSPPD